MTMTEKTVMWSAYETIGLAITQVSTVTRMEVTPEMWDSLCVKAEAAGMEPEAWLDAEIERLTPEEGT